MRHKSAGAKSNKYGGWGRSVISCFVRKSRIRREESAGAFSRWNIHFSPYTNQAFFSSLSLSAFSSPSDIPCLPSGHEVEIQDKKKRERGGGGEEEE